MDRLIYTALNAITTLREVQATTAQNLSNLSVPGFRRDFPDEGVPRYLETPDAQVSRVFQTERGPQAFSERAGLLERTDEPMDVAIADEGYFYIEPPGGGDPALSRRGDLMVQADGTLTNGAGEAMLGTNNVPIRLPPFRSLLVDSVGQLLIEPLDGPPGERVLAGVLATVVPEGVDLRKSDDGRIRTVDGSPLPPPDQRARVMQGVREGSNVNNLEELIGTIELQRAFEMNMRMIQTAREVDESGAALLRVPMT
jgi:flagellar basal-body rod protein FlgF